MNKPNVNVMVGGPINEDYPRIYKTKYIKPLIPLSGQITDVNTKYVIRYNHNLDGEEVIVPEGCTIEFDGGSITNGTLVGDNTRLVYEGSLDSFVIDAELKGTFIHNDDRPYDSSNGLYSQGQVTFEKNIINGKNVLTQDMFMKDDPENPGRRIPNTNTVFVIKYDFYLTLDSFYDECYDSARDYHYISLPNNCVLKFEGGCIHNENFRYIEDGVIKYNDYRLRIEAGNNCLVIEDGHMILDYVPIGYRFNNEFLMASSIGVNQQNTLDNGARLNCFYQGTRCGIKLDAIPYGSSYIIEEPVCIPAEGGKIIGSGSKTGNASVLVPTDDFYQLYPNRGVVETANYWAGLPGARRDSVVMFSDAINVSNLQIQCNNNADYGLVSWASGENNNIDRLFITNARKACIFFGGLCAIARAKRCFVSTLSDDAYGYMFGNHPDPDFAPGIRAASGGRGEGGSASLIESSGDCRNWINTGLGAIAIDIVAPKMEQVKHAVTSLYGVDFAIASQQQISITGGRIEFADEVYNPDDPKHPIKNYDRVLLTAYSENNTNVVVRGMFMPKCLHFAHYTKDDSYITAVNNEHRSSVTFWTNSYTELRDVTIYNSEDKTFVFDSNYLTGKKKPGAKVTLFEPNLPAGFKQVFTPAIGYCFFDKILMKPIWYSGDSSGNKTGWLDALGNPILENDIYVDLGLPSGTLWARRNIDITQENGFTANLAQYECSFFSWGNIDGHNPEYKQETERFEFDYSFYDINVYNGTPGGALVTNIPAIAGYDAACAILGKDWKMPTFKEIKELYEYCDFVDGITDNANVIPKNNASMSKVVVIDGVNVFCLRGPNGKIIVFPYAGRAGNDQGDIGHHLWDNRGSMAFLISSNIHFSQTGEPSDKCDSYRFTEYGKGSMEYEFRDYGFPIRPVRS